MEKNSGSTKYFLALVVLFAFNFLLHLNTVQRDVQGLHSWRQSQTMWNIRNFARHDANILNPRVCSFNGDNDNLYRYEFPVMQWGAAMLQRVFGEDITVVRLWMFLLGSCGTVGIFALMTLLLSSKLSALITAFLFQFSPIFNYYSFTPLPDILALTAAIWYLYFIVKYKQEKKIGHFLLSAVFLTLATLAKLPFLMFGSVTLIIFGQAFFKDRKAVGKISLLAAAQAVFLLPAFAWYAWVMPTWTGNPVLQGIFGGGFSILEFFKLIGFHAVKMFPNKLLSFPIWLPFLLGIFVLLKNRTRNTWLFGLIGITFLYLLLQLNTIGRAHDYYLLPFLPWLFVVTGFGVEKIREQFTHGKAVLLTICAASVVYTCRLTRDWSSLAMTAFNEDVFVHSEALQNAVPAGERCIILNDRTGYIFAYRIDKQGYIFQNDKLPVAWLNAMITKNGVKYMYSDSRTFDQKPEVQPYLQALISEKGSVRVFKLTAPD